jgi:hypothetical protein
MVNVMIAPMVASLMARIGFDSRSWIHLIVSSRNWKQLGVLLIQSTRSRPRIELSILAGSGKAALGIQMDCRGNRTGLHGSCEAAS